MHFPAGFYLDPYNGQKPIAVERRRLGSTRRRSVYVDGERDSDGNSFDFGGFGEPGGNPGGD